jgi:transposase
VGQAITIGMDIAKQVFQLHGADEAGSVVFRRKITRAKLLAFFASQAPCLVVMEACGGAHHWAREIGKLGHQGLTSRFVRQNTQIGTNKERMAR